MTRSEVAFQHGNPVLLTETGEFVLKNIVLVAAGLAITADLLGYEFEFQSSTLVAKASGRLNSPQTDSTGGRTIELSGQMLTL